MAKLTKVKNFFGWIWQAIKNLFKTKYHITIYRTSESGSGAMYKSEYVSRNILINKPKHLKFRESIFYWYHPCVRDGFILSV